MTDAPVPFVPLDPRRVLARIEELCAEPPSEAPEGVTSLGELASPGALEDLLGLHLGRLVRQGPGGPAGADGPGRLLRLAVLAAEVGVVAVAAPGRLRRRLDDLAARLVEDGLWHPEAPPWWHPLPAVGPLGETAEAAVRALRLPRGAVVREAFDDPGDRRWLAPSDLLDADWVAAIHAELEGAHAAGALGLEREGVGASGRRSVRRTDIVTYLTGREPELLSALPTLAVTVQELLAGLRDWLGQSVPEAHLSAPQTAMLARYEAPSRGFDPHLDNPGLGSPHQPERDNGRTLTLVTYLSAPEAPPNGGEIALWSARDRARPGESGEEPVGVFPPRAGSAVLFDSRRVPHQVRPVAEGPARWALTVWITDRAGMDEIRLPAPAVTPTEALVAVSDPPLPPGRVLLHELDGDDPAGRLVSREIPESPPMLREPRAAVVATVYREGERLDAWCHHHLELGFERLFVVFDHLEEPAERQTAARLRETFGASVEILDGRDVARCWSDLPEVARRVGGHDLIELAGCGGAAWAVASRQALNASVVLEQAREQGLRWLLHLDGDERFHLEGRGRGGTTLPEHFAAADAAGLLQMRYLNHELLVSRGGGDPLAEPRFKINPRLAAARLGSRGWQGVARALGLGDDRPWFNGYLNGKSAVRLDAARAAAGCHGWRLSEEALEAVRQAGGTAGCLLAGPSVLHFHFARPESFRAKYRAMAAVPERAEAERPFEPAPTEAAAVALVRRLVADGATDGEIDRALDALRVRMTTFSDEEIELLDEVGLLLRPVTSPAPAG